MPAPTVRRETFSSRLGLLATMIGVAVGLGNVWRFPYMVGRFGGASFVLVYVLLVAFLGVPALLAEWTLGRETRRGPVGAFRLAGLPGGQVIGWLFFGVVMFAVGYYTNAVGWVLTYGLAEAMRLVGSGFDASSALPPDAGFDGRSLAIQLVASGVLVLASMAILLRGLRRGIERASTVIIPTLFVCLLILIIRAVTLDGAEEGLRWYIGKLDWASISPAVVLAALGQACFTLSLGGTFMVVYGSYLPKDTPLAGNAVITAGADLVAGLLAGLAIFPAVFAFGLEPDSGPGLIFFTLPKVFAALPLGGLFGVVFYTGLLGAAFLSILGAFEVLIAGLVDNTRLNRRQATWTLGAVVYLTAIAPMINMRIFSVWDLTFGSGMQTFGALVTVITVAWCLNRAAALRQLEGVPHVRFLYWWLRYVVPAAILTVGIWWLLSDVLGVASAS